MRFVLIFLALGLGGCVEVDEHLVLDGKSGGTYSLSVRWNAELWRRASEHLPKATQRRLEGHPFPLREAAWRDGLRDLDGVEVVALTSDRPGGGWRRLSVELGFERLEDLLRWEVLARRSVALTVERKGTRDDAPRVATLSMDPIPFVPVLDPVAAVLAAEDAPPPKAEGLRAHRDPPPLQRLGLEREAAGDLWRWVGPQVRKALFRFRVTVPGALQQFGGRAAEGQEGAREIDFAALGDPRTDRRIEAVWRVRTLDDTPEVDHEGEDRSRVVDRVRAR